MHLSDDRLDALVAVLRQGSFEQAARQLHVTPSAISQRIKSLENEVGSVLVVRASPCVATETGQLLYRHGLQVEQLSDEVIARLGRGDDSTATRTVAIAINADSLAAWIIPALDLLRTATRTRVELVVDDEAHTAQWLRTGRVVAAITTLPRAVQGCVVRKLGTLRYRATASRRFVRNALGGDCSGKALAAAPCLAFDRRDHACRDFLRRTLGMRGVELSPHYVPSPQGYLQFCLRGIAWGLNPALTADPLIQRGRLVDLAPGNTFDVALHWQQWELAPTKVDDLGRALAERATEVLAD